MRFTKQQRILSPEDYQRVFKTGKRKVIPGFAVYIAADRDTGPRLGLAISKKYTSLAVDRNYLKRVLREYFRQKQHELPSLDLVFVSQKGVNQLSNTELRASLENFFNQLSGV